MPALGWAPAVFWSASLAEFFAAIDGYHDMHAAPDDPGPMTRADYEQLKAEHG